MEKQLPYASEVIKIIEGGLERDAKKVRAYTELLLMKMRHDDFDLSVQGCITARLSGEYKNMPIIVAKDAKIPMVRPEIVDFAQAMERQMAKHDKERGDSWKAATHLYLQSRMQEEVEESMSEDAVIGEWIDIANFCMMIYWNTTHGG